MTSKIVQPMTVPLSTEEVVSLVINVIQCFLASESKIFQENQLYSTWTSKYRSEDEMGLIAHTHSELKPENSWLSMQMKILSNRR